MIATRYTATLAIVLLVSTSFAADIPWSDDLNDFFGSQLDAPSYDEVVGAMANRLNRHTLRGVSPSEEYDAFRKYLHGIKDGLPKAERKARYLAQLYQHMCDYLDLEEEFYRKARTKLPARLTRLVEQQALLDPAWDESRTTAVLDRIENQHLFVPSTILFHEYLLPVRPKPLPEGARILEVPVVQRYRDGEHEVEALFDLMGPVGRVCRLDFESFGAISALVEQSQDGKRFQSVQHVTSEASGGIRAPIIFDDPFMARYVKLGLRSPVGQAVLHEVRLFAIKTASAAVSRHASASPKVDGVLDDAAWNFEPQVYGFVSESSGAFAGVPTGVRILHTDDALYFGAVMYETRIDTMVYGDSIAEGGESLEIHIRTGRGETMCYSISPQGVQTTGCDFAVAGTARWDAAVQVNDTNWTAEIRIPFTTLGRLPMPGNRWRVNFHRMRNNVVSERSSWAPNATEKPATPAMGLLTFPG